MRWPLFVALAVGSLSVSGGASAQATRPGAAVTSEVAADGAGESTPAPAEGQPSIAPSTLTGPSTSPASSEALPVPETPAMADQQNLLLDIKSQLAALKTQLERAERRVSVLKEAVLGGPIVATNVVLVHRNEVGGPFALERATYVLDGGVIFEEGNTDGRLEDQKVFELFNGGMTPGPHQLRVVLEFRGRAMGPFTYLEGYGFRVKSGCNFEVDEGRSHRIEVVASQSGDATLEPQEQLSVRCDVVDGGQRPKTKNVPASPPPSVKPPPETPAIDAVPASDDAVLPASPSGARPSLQLGGR